MKRRPDDMSKRRHDVKRKRHFFDAKMFALTLVFVLAAVAIIQCFYQLQIVDHEVLAAKAAGQQYVTLKEHPKRGMILDRNGYPLVFSTFVYRVGITPVDVYSNKKDITDEVIVDKMTECLHLDEEESATILELIRADRVRGWDGIGQQFAGHQAVTYRVIATEVKETDATLLQTWTRDNNVGGIRFDAEERRVYSNHGLASSVLGLINIRDGQIVATSGLEFAYNSLLSGETGMVYAKRNNYATRGVIPYSEPIENPGLKGRHLISTLDTEASAILKEELLSVATAAGLIKGVHGLIMEVKTGHIIAMEQVPSFDAESPADIPLGLAEDFWQEMESEERTAYLSSNLWNNVNITDVYEPGSVFKALTLAIALEEGVAWEQTVFNDDPVTIQGEEISCYSVVGHGDETLEKAFYLSCNPVFVHLGERIGQNLYYDWIQKLGLYSKTGIDLPAEASGLLHRNPMPIDFANLTFGESSSLTAIQLASLFASIGNGGYQVTPRVGYASTESGLESMEVFATEEAKQIFSQETCTRVRRLMTDVVTRGTAAGTFGAMGFSMGGKTGTAIDAADGRRTFSFVGLVPTDEPEYVVLVSIHKPETGITLSSSAARAANRVAARLMNLEGRRQHYSDQELNTLSHAVELPDMSDLTVGEAAMALLQLNLAPSLSEDYFYPDRPLARMEPAPGTRVGVGSTIWLYPEGHNEVEWVAVPDFSGLNYHECVWLAAAYGVTIIPEGLVSGQAINQSVLPSVRVSDDPAMDIAGSPERERDEDRRAEGKVKRGHTVTVYFQNGTGDSDSGE